VLTDDIYGVDITNFLKTIFSVVMQCITIICSTIVCFSDSVTSEKFYIFGTVADVLPNLQNLQRRIRAA